MIKKIFIWPLGLILLDLLLLFIGIIISYNNPSENAYGTMVFVFLLSYEINSLIIYFCLTLGSWLLSKRLKILKIDTKMIIIYGLVSMILALILHFFTANLIKLLLNFFALFNRY